MRVRDMLTSTIAFRAVLGIVFATPCVVALPSTQGVDLYKTGGLGVMAALLVYLVHFLVRNQYGLLLRIDKTLGELRDAIRDMKS